MMPVVTHPPRTLRGLYVITSTALCADSTLLLECAEAALRGGARVLQYRDKSNTAGLRQRQAAALVGLCRRFGAFMIVNDDIDLARVVGADGVHLGASDASIEAARDRLGMHALIGASCGASLERATAATAAGASYVAFGRFYPSRTKPNAAPARIELLSRARRELDQTLCAIGGVTPDNGMPLVAAGADLLAAVDGLFGSCDPIQVERAARAYTQLFRAAVPDDPSVVRPAPLPNLTSTRIATIRSP